MLATKCNEDCLHFCLRRLRWLGSQAGAHSFILMWIWHETIKNWGQHKLVHKSPSSSCKHWADVPNILSNVPKGGCYLPSSAHLLPAAPSSSLETTDGCRSHFCILSGGSHQGSVPLKRTIWTMLVLFSQHLDLFYVFWVYALVPFKNVHQYQCVF